MSASNVFVGVLFGTPATQTEQSDPTVTKITIGDDIIVPFPNEYIIYGSWNSTPDQREDIKAYRNDRTRNLKRYVASGRKSIFSFKTRPNLHLNDKKAILKFFTDHETNSAERKIGLLFWDEEASIYKRGYFYRPNMKFPIKKITDDDIIYDSLEFSFVEY